MTDVSTNALTNADYAPDGAAITTSGTPLSVDPNTRAYLITSGGTGGDEFIDLPKFPLNGAGINALMIAQRVIFYFETQTNPSDVVKIRTNNQSPNIGVYGPTGPGYAVVSDAAVLDFSGAVATFVWGADQWMLDQGLIDSNNSSIYKTIDIVIAPSQAAGDGDAGTLTVGGGFAPGAGNGGDLRLSAGASDSGTNGKIKVLGIPTADPHIANALWNNSGVLTISAG